MRKEVCSHPQILTHQGVGNDTFVCVGYTWRSGNEGDPEGFSKGSQRQFESAHFKLCVWPSGTFFRDIVRGESSWIVSVLLLRFLIVYVLFEISMSLLYCENWYDSHLLCFIWLTWPTLLPMKKNGFLLEAALVFWDCRVLRYQGEANNGEILREVSRFIVFVATLSCKCDTAVGWSNQWRLDGIDICYLSTGEPVSGYQTWRHFESQFNFEESIS